MACTHHIPLSDTTMRILALLESHAFEAWVVGGCVRDALQNIPLFDIDIACSAPWQKTKSIMENEGYSCHETGIDFGTLTVIANNESFEITTFRHESGYSDHRHPNSVETVSSITEDLARRDLTINAMAYHPDRGILDPFNGQNDLRSGIIRTVGNPYMRFSEDALRMLRALRFSSKLEFHIDKTTADALHDHRELLHQVSAERMQKELDGLLIGPGAMRVILEFVDVLGVPIPELPELQGFDQKNPYHAYDVLEHTARAVDHAKKTPLNRWATLLHDIAKPQCFRLDNKGKGHFPNHPQEGAEIASNILRRLRYPKRFVADVNTLITYHDTTIEPNEQGVCRMLHKLNGRVDLFRELCDIKEADESAKSDLAVDRIRGIKRLPKILDDVIEEDLPYSIRSLDVNGADLIAEGIAPGPEIANTLEAMLEAVIDGRVCNQKEELLAFTRRLHCRL